MKRFRLRPGVADQNRIAPSKRDKAYFRTAIRTSYLWASARVIHHSAASLALKHTTVTDAARACCICATFAYNRTRRALDVNLDNLALFANAKARNNLLFGWTHVEVAPNKLLSNWVPPTINIRRAGTLREFLVNQSGWLDRVVLGYP